MSFSPGRCPPAEGERRFAEQMNPLRAELGGKDPPFVLADADLDAAALKLAWGAFANSARPARRRARLRAREHRAGLTAKLVNSRRACARASRTATTWTWAR